MISSLRQLWSVVLLTVFLSSVLTVSSQYTQHEEDGLWYLRLIGDVDQWVYDGRGRGIASAIATDNRNHEEFILASIELDTGDLAWRQTIPGYEGKIEKMLLDGNSVLTLSGENLLRKFDIEDGSLIWQSKQSIADNSIGPNSNDFVVVGESNLALIDNDILSMVYRFDGSILWKTKIETDIKIESRKVSKLLVDFSSETIYVLSYYIDINEIVVASLTLGTGKMMASNSFKLSDVSEDCSNVLKFDFFDSSLASHQFFNVIYLCDTPSSPLRSLALDKDSLLFTKLETVGWLDSSDRNLHQNPLQTSSDDGLRLVSFDLVSTQTVSATDFESETHDTRDIALIFENTNTSSRTTKLYRARHAYGNKSLNLAEKRLITSKNNKNNKNKNKKIAKNAQIIYCSNEDAAVLTISPDSTSAQLDVSSEASGQSAPISFALNSDEFASFAANRGRVESCFYDSTSGPNKASLLVKTQDACISFFTSNSDDSTSLQLAWEREEALSSPLQVFMFDVFEEDSMCDSEEECDRVYHRSFPSFFSRLSQDLSPRSLSLALDWLLDRINVMHLVRSMNFGDLFRSVPLLPPPLQDALSGVFGGAPGSSQTLQKNNKKKAPAPAGWTEALDTKVITILTRSGKLYGLDSDSGAVLWSILIDADVADEEQSFEVVSMLAVRAHPAQLLIVTASQQLQKTRLISVQAPFHGPHPPAVHVTELLDAVVQNAVETNVMNEDQVKLILLPLEGSDRVMSWPAENKKESKQLVPEGAIYYYNVDFRDNYQCLTGYVIRYDKETKQFGQSVVWNKSFLYSSERIADVATAGKNEVIINSIYRTGELGAIYKWLSPHLVAVATYDLDARILHVYLLDSITGAQIEHSYHRSAAPSPISLLLFENKLLYTWFDELKQLTTLVSWDMWMSDPGQVPKTSRTAAEGWIVPENPLESNEFSVFSAPMPIITSQAYNFGHTIDRLLGVSKTKWGLCDRVVLAKTQGSSLIKINTKLLNTRRPLVADHAVTPANREEGLRPYKRFLPFVTLSVLSRDVSLPGLSGAVSVGGSVESQSIILGWGLDLIKCKFTASRTSFDRLDTNLFDLKMLFLILCVIVGAIYAAKYFAARKKLNKEWQ